MIVKTTSYGMCELRKEAYFGNKRIALELWNNGPVAMLTVNIPEATLFPGEFLVKTWSENEEIAADCLRSGLFVDTGKRVKTGWVEAQVWRFA